jgi:transposase InsO family protein
LRYGRPEIFNTDQGSQFTSDDFTGTLKDHGITISMDGKGRCMDNIFVERLWRSHASRASSESGEMLAFAHTHKHRSQQTI